VQLECVSLWVIYQQKKESVHIHTQGTSTQSNAYAHALLCRYKITHTRQTTRASLVHGLLVCLFVSFLSILTALFRGSAFVSKHNRTRYLHPFRCHPHLFALSFTSAIAYHRLLLAHLFYSMVFRQLSSPFVSSFYSIHGVLLFSCLTFLHQCQCICCLLHAHAPCPPYPLLNANATNIGTLEH
jgi:hypothetical protein